MNWRIVTAIAVCAAAVVAAGVFWLHTSACFMWAAAGKEYDWKGYVNLKSKSAQDFKILLEPYQEKVKTPFDISHAARVVWKRSGSKDQFVILPVWNKRKALQEDLSRTHIEHQSLGLLIMIGNSKYDLYKDLDRSIAWNPIFIFRNSSQEIIGEENMSRGEAKSGLTASLPGNVVALLPQKIQEEWNEKMWQRLGFTYIKPRIVSELSKFANIKISLSESDIIMTTEGNPDQWERMVRQWVSTELSYRNPEVRAFKLPDGTLGYEKAPQTFEQITLFSNTTQEPGCREEKALGRPLYFCRMENQASISTKPQISGHRISQDFPEASWDIMLGKDIAQSLGSGNIESFTAWGNDNHARVVIHTY